MIGLWDSFPIFQWINNVTNFEYTSEFVIRIEKIEGITFSQVWTCRFYNEWFGFENYTPISFQYFPATSLWDETNILAKKEGKTPVVALCEKERPGFWIIVHSDDLDKLIKEK